jgi:hypothetical protein
MPPNAGPIVVRRLLEVESEAVRTLFRIDTHEIDDIQAPQLIANIWIPHLVDPTRSTN